MLNITREEVVSSVKDGLKLYAQSETDDDFSRVICPVCGYDYIHPEDPVEISGGDRYLAAPAFIRGDVIAIPMWCENGHVFATCFGFHKGYTRTWATYIRDWTGEDLN